jgi:hypothetical protein
LLHFRAACSWIVAVPREFLDCRNLRIQIRVGVAHVVTNSPEVASVRSLPNRTIAAQSVNEGSILVAGQHKAQPDDKEKSQRGKLKTFIVAHNRSLSFLGLLIVFATYVAKETLLEEVKGSADSIESAQQQLAVRQECLSTKNELALLERNLPTTDEAAGKSSRRTKSLVRTAIDDQLYLVDHYNEGMDVLMRALDLVRDQYDASASVARSLPSGNSAADSLKYAQASITDALQAIEKVRRQVENFDGHSVKEPVYSSVRQKTIDAYLGLGIPFEKARDATDTITTIVSIVAEETLDKKKAGVRKIKLACQLLFVFGWRLSLVDKMFLSTGGSIGE